MGKPHAYPVPLAFGKPYLVRLSLFGFGLSELGEYVDNLIFVKEPFYIENVIETILIHLIRLEYIAIGSIKERFPELENNHSWKKKAYAFDKEASKWITTQFSPK